MSKEVDDDCWMEGVVDQRITKASHAKNIGYTTKRFNVIKVLRNVETFQVVLPLK